jgi:hypothetical protein
LQRDGKLKRDDYEVRTALQQDVLEGRKGKLYEIDIKKADKVGSLNFGPGSVSEDVYVGRFKSVMRKIQDELSFEPAGGDLYLLGSADKKSALTFMDKRPTKYSTITYLPRKEAKGSLFRSVAVTKKIPDHIRNKDLPNLRSLFVLDCLRTMGKDATILDGVVTDRVDANDRTVVVLLFIPESDA